MIATKEQLEQHIYKLLRSYKETHHQAQRTAKILADRYAYKLPIKGEDSYEWLDVRCHTYQYIHNRPRHYVTYDA